MDDPDSLINDRLIELGIKDHPDLYVPQDIDYSDPIALLTYTLKVATDLKPVLIVIDCLYKLLPKKREAGNDASLMAPLLNLLNIVAEKSGAALVLIHHFKKNEDEIAGSFATRAAIKVLVTLTKPKPPGRHRADEAPEEVDESMRVLSLMKSKLVRQNAWDLRLEGVGKWKILDAQEKRLSTANTIVKANPETGKAKAIAWLKEALSNGAVREQVALYVEGKLLGHSEKNIREARGVLGVKPQWIERKSHLYIPTSPRSPEEVLARLDAFYRGKPSRNEDPEEEGLLGEMGALDDKGEKGLL